MWIIIINALVGIATIITNILIARYNVGKNRKIYGVKTLSTLGVHDINTELKNGDYTILHVGPGNHIGAHTYVLGKI